jgi:K(+)-stimulated pyrophosphate-energized sodium pump
MQEIAAAIQEGAQAYLNRQYTTIGIVGVVIFVSRLVPARLAGRHRLPDRRGAVGRGRLHRHERLGARQRAHGAGGSSKSLARASTSPSSRAPSPACWWPASRCSASPATTHPDRSLGLEPADRTVIDALVALGFGASLISIFARLGGGIFTKGADVGGDMVGKVEAGIPEDDPRNPATIADNVGDNVGDCAGMAADLFETYAVTTVATMVLAAIFFASALLAGMMLLPLAICGVCIVTSIIGTFFVKLGPTTTSWAPSTRA